MPAIIPYLIKYWRELFFVAFLGMAWLWLQSVKQGEYQRGLAEAEKHCIQEKLAQAKAAKLSIERAVAQRQKDHAAKSQRLANKLALERKKSGEQNAKIQQYIKSNAANHVCFDDDGLLLFNAD